MRRFSNALMMGLSFMLLGCGARLRVADPAAPESSTPKTQIKLGWDTPAQSAAMGIAGYRVYMGTATGQYTVSFDAGAQSLFTVGDLRSNQMYCFTVVSYSTTNVESEFSNEVCSLPTM